MPNLKVEVLEQQPTCLGRQLVHDPKSRGFPARVEIDKSRWKDKRIRIYDPSPNPNQCHGECTGVAKCMEFNAVGNRVPLIVLTMDVAHKIYSRASQIDPFRNQWPPVDTGSSGLAAAKAAKEFGLGGEYRHVFGGADEVVQLIMMNRVVNVGTWWYDTMFKPNKQNIIEPSGPRAGGHQYIARGYDVDNDLVMIRCWWGSFRDVWIRRIRLHELLMDDGDAHIQNRLWS